MSWNPDSGTPLSSGPISVAAVEKTSLTLWHEYISGWMDGSSHSVRGAPVQMPLAKVTFQDMEIPAKTEQDSVKGFEGLSVHITCDMGTIKRRLYGNGMRMIHQDADIDFYVGAFVKSARSDGRNSRALCQWASDTLFAIMTSNLLATPLTRRGMSILRPQPPYLLGGDKNMSMRHMPLTVRYTYPADETVDASPALPEGYYFDDNTRVGANGIEQKAEDGNWYAVDVSIADGFTGPVAGLSPRQVPAPSTPVGRVLTYVYFGPDMASRVGPNGFERKGPDGNWYVIEISLSGGVAGVSPTLVS